MRVSEWLGESKDIKKPMLGIGLGRDRFFILNALSDFGFQRLFIAIGQERQFQAI